MKKRIKITLTAISIIALLIIGLIIGISLMSKPTRGKTIAQYPFPKKALLVIDTQEDFIGLNNKMKNKFGDVTSFINDINLIQQRAVERGMVIIYIRQIYSGGFGKTMSHLFMNKSALSDNPGSLMDKRIHLLTKNDFTKKIGDAFSNPVFERFLIDNSINELYLCGMDGEFCVYSTAKGALNRGYKVNIFVDGILLGNPSHYDDLLQKYINDGIHLYNRNFQEMNKH